jgi:dTDP-4-amino-4,6-dideoxygalactose transaminase
MPNLDFVSDFSAPLFEQPESADELYRRQFSWSARFWKGRVALFAILRALGIGPGDSVLVPGYTCVVVPSAVQFVGAKPVYVDIEADGYNIGRKTVEEAYNRALESGQRPPRAVIIQHTYGIPPEVGPLFEFAREHRLFVIEDR